MSCERVEELLSAYLDEMLAPGERRSVATHLRKCQHCQTILDDYRRFDALLAQLPPVSPGPAVRQKLFSSLAQNPLPVTDELQPIPADRYIDSYSPTRPSLPSLPDVFSSNTTPTRRQPALRRPLPIGSNDLTRKVPVVAPRKSSVGQRALLGVIAAALLLAVGIGSIMGWQLMSATQQQRATGSGNAITPPAGYSSTTLPLPAGNRFVFLHAGALWSASTDTSPAQARLTPPNVTVGGRWLVSPAAPGQAAGDMLAYIDIQHGYVHVIRSDGQNDTVVPLPLLGSRAPTAALWQTAEGQAILNGLSWSPSGAQLAFVADPQSSGKPALYIYTLSSNSVQVVAPSQNGVAAMPVWSPDGIRLAFALTEATGTATQIIDYNTRDKSFLAVATINAPDTLFSLNWSPDVALPAITWSTGSDGIVHRVEIVVIDMMHTPRLLAQGNFSQAIYASEANNGVGGWLLVDAQSGPISLEDVNLVGESSILARGHAVTLAQWSPDADFVDYLVTTNANISALHLVNLANGENRVVADTVASTPLPVWSTDSHRLAYSTGQQIYIYTVASASTSPVSSITATVSALFWLLPSPSGTSTLLLVTSQGMLYAASGTSQPASKLSIDNVQGSVQWTQIP